MKHVLFAALLGWSVTAPAQVIFYDRYLGTVISGYPSTLLAPCSPWCNYETRNKVQERRKARFDSLRADEAPPATLPGSRGMPRSTAALTPESEIQPAYRTSGRVREEFDDRSKVLPQFEETGVAPAKTVAVTGSPASPQPATPAAAPSKRRATPMLPCPKGAAEC
jgi:hypothetical protein